ncbi:threonine transporter RhtB [Rhizobium sp. Leaf384]|uniref:LysE family translocator n=1 Tax=unclassified Rhizobium TaxID=2613769 RepID=UPI00071310A9|nr:MULTISPECIES: LysE family translocator [unclassified Rhizobium]KQS76208.1 threonine transporter RhtB [Rhizobium sp. Leaf384]KQS78522.1 threonine transporter RhtB [Rhizobium sp. Leaf383]
MDLIPNLPTLLAFAAASLLLAITPGPDMTLWISRALSQGRAAAFQVSLGTNLGCLVHTFLVAFGVSALVTASPTAFFVLKTGGAAYLLYIAVQAVRFGSSLSVKRLAAPKASAMTNVLSGLSVNLLNPKVIIFFMTFLPQFVTAGDPNIRTKLIVLGLVLIGVSLPINIAVVLMADRLSGWLQARPGVMRTIDYVFAGVFSLFAVKIVLTQAR